MKKYILEFCRRGIMASIFGPLVLAVVYLILQQKGVLQTLTGTEVFIGIFTLAALAFVAGGLSSLYQIEQLPLMVAILIHGSVLYGAYLVTYLLNGWLEKGTISILAFTVIFVLGYLMIWAVIYSVHKTRIARLNKILKMKQQKEL